MPDPGDIHIEGNDPYVRSTTEGDPNTRPERVTLRRWTIAGGYAGARHELFVRPREPEPGDPCYIAPHVTVDVVSLRDTLAWLDEQIEKATKDGRSVGRDAERAAFRHVRSYLEGNQ